MMELLSLHSEAAFAETTAENIRQAPMVRVKRTGKIGTVKSHWLAGVIVEFPAPPRSPFVPSGLFTFEEVEPVEP